MTGAGLGGNGRPPAADEVHVWKLALDAAEPPLARLPAADRERALTLRSGPTRSRWAAARWGLLRILGRYTSCEPIDVHLEVGEFGKPAIADPNAEIRFNLSHSGAAALVAVAQGTEVGVDLERVAPRRDLVGLAERGIGPEAAAALRRTPPERRPRTFYAQWVRREAAAKCLGVGLARPLPEIPVSAVELDLGDDWAGAVAVAAPRPPRVRVLELAR